MSVRGIARRVLGAARPRDRAPPDGVRPRRDRAPLRGERGPDDERDDRDSPPPADTCRGDRACRVARVLGLRRVASRRGHHGNGPHHASASRHRETEMTRDVAWLAGLSPWPEDGFGLDRMSALLAALDEPAADYPAIHVVGTNGKSTATVTIEQLLLGDGLNVGATVSPHVSSWDERIRIGGRPADLEVALARVRPAAEEVAATQFETITAAALTAFAAAGVDVAVVEAGLGGRYDATNVLSRKVVLLTSVGLEHTDVLGETVEEIATEKLAVVHDDNIVVVLPDDTFAGSSRATRSCSAARARQQRRSSAIRSRHAVDVAPAGQARAARRRDSRRRPQSRRRRLARRAPRHGRLHDLRLDPRRQGRRRDAASARAGRPALRRDRVVERALALRGRARRAGPRSIRGRRGGGGPDSRRCVARTRSASPFSSPDRCISSPISRRRRAR